MEKDETPFGDGWAADVMKLTKSQIIEFLRHAYMDNIALKDRRYELQNLMVDIARWSDATFGEGQRNPAMLHHLKKEVQECIDAVEKFQKGSSIESPYFESEKRCREAFDEYADCFMLLLDSAYHFGLDAQAIILFTRDKLEVNRKRKWGKPDCNGVIEHIKEE